MNFKNNPDRWTHVKSERYKSHFCQSSVIRCHQNSKRNWPEVTTQELVSLLSLSTKLPCLMFHSVVFVSVERRFLQNQLGAAFLVLNHKEKQRYRNKREVSVSVTKVKFQTLLWNIFTFLPLILNVGSKVRVVNELKWENFDEIRLILTFKCL